MESWDLFEVWTNREEMLFLWHDIIDGTKKITRMKEKKEVEKKERKKKKGNSGRKSSICFQSTPWYHFRFGMNETGVEKSTEKGQRRKQKERREK